MSDLTGVTGGWGGAMGGAGGGKGDKGLKLGLADTLRLAWQDADLKQRILFVLFMFGVYALGVHIPVPIPGVDPVSFERLVENNSFFALLNTFGGGGLKRISIFALGLNPYITASIIMQIVSAAYPKFKQELQEGGEYARRQQNKRTRILTILLAVFQGLGVIRIFETAGALSSVTVPLWVVKVSVILFWTAGSFFLLWIGEQISERGIGQGVSLIIFAGIVISFPGIIQIVYEAVQNGTISIFQALGLIVMFLVTTWFVTMFTIAQRRIPIQHMRRQFGTKAVGGTTNYLPFSLNLVGVIPIIFAVSLVYMPAQFASMGTPNSGWYNFWDTIARFMNPNFSTWQGWVGCLAYTMLIFFFTYFYTAVQYNVEDIANNLKRAGSFIPGVRPGKQTKDFLDGVISRITMIGAVFLAIIALTQYIVPLIAPISTLGLLFGTSLLIMVSVALETMRQIEANLLMKQYGG